MRRQMYELENIYRRTFYPRPIWIWPVTLIYVTNMQTEIWTVPKQGMQSKALIIIHKYVMREGSLCGNHLRFTRAQDEFYNIKSGLKEISFLLLLFFSEPFTASMHCESQTESPFGKCIFSVTLNLENSQFERHWLTLLKSHFAFLCSPETWSQLLSLESCLPAKQFFIPGSYSVFTTLG